jgi:hypothetical protein
MLAFVHSLDRRDWKGYANTFSEDGVFEIMGQRRTGRAAIAAGPARDLGVFARTQHFLTNHTIELANDTATATHYLFAVHILDAGRPDEHADIGGQYRCQCTRTAEGWRFEHVELEIWWTAGQQLAIQPADGTERR